MRTEITGGGVVALAGVVGVGLLGAWLYSNRKEVVAAINPASDKNIAYQSVNKATQALTGQKDTSFGSWLYDITHPNQPDITAPTPVRAQTGWDDIMLRRAREAAGLGLTDMGFVEALGAAGKKELVPPMTPTTWVLIAGASVALYAHSKRKSRRGRK